MLFFVIRTFVCLMKNLKLRPLLPTQMGERAKYHILWATERLCTFFTHKSSLWSKYQEITYKILTQWDLDRDLSKAPFTTQGSLLGWSSDFPMNIPSLLYLPIWPDVYLPAAPFMVPPPWGFVFFSFSRSSPFTVQLWLLPNLLFTINWKTWYAPVGIVWLTELCLCVFSLSL